MAVEVHPAKAVRQTPYQRWEAATRPPKAVEVHPARAVRQTPYQRWEAAAARTPAKKKSLMDVVKEEYQHQYKILMQDTTM